MTAYDIPPEVRMRSTSFSPALFAIAIPLAFAADRASQLARPDFNGRWTLVPGETSVGGGGRGDGSGNASGGGGRAGGGTGLGSPADELAIQQNDSMLTIGARRETVTDTIRYRLDGKPGRNLMTVGRGETVHGNYTSRWNRARLETTITRTIGTRAIRYRELLYLISDSTLVLETDVVGSIGGRKVVYRKAR